MQTTMQCIILQCNKRFLYLRGRDQMTHVKNIYGEMKPEITADDLEAEAEVQTTEIDEE